ncbi:hypothetical protein HY227_01350 [Candidatus Wolfebacteria bacterium]|nr:hypothetical protein [Candidatus Wolfebacteria bacterium]
MIKFKGAGNTEYQIIFPGTGYSSFEIHGGDGGPQIGIGMKNLAEAMAKICEKEVEEAYQKARQRAIIGEVGAEEWAKEFSEECKRAGYVPH